MITKQRISKELVNKITKYLLSFGDESRPIKLPPERTIAEKFGVSRRCVRLAVEKLESRGLIRRKQGCGNFLIPKKFQTKKIGLLIPDNVKPNDPFFASLITQFLLYSRENDINLIVIKNEQMLAGIDEDIPIIIIAEPEKKLIKEIRSQKSNVITTFDIKDEDICCVLYDDEYVGRESAKILAEYNHKNVLILAGTKTVQPAAIKRYQAFIKKCEELGLNVEVVEGKMNYKGGYQAMKWFLENSGKERIRSVTGIFASTDWMAAGAYQAINEAGFSIPEDFSIIGCDDVPLASELNPGLSTFRLDIAELVEKVFLLIEGLWRTPLPEKILLRPRFIRRNSLIGGV